MTQGFYTAISGITTSQQKIDVISDNIANINTVGFKGSVINFSDVYAKTLTLGSAPTKTIGGTNPMQIGLGTKTANISKDFTIGANQSTGILSDLFLDGQGFFCVEGANNEILLTRAGNFSVDSDGYMVASGGNRVLGTSTAYSVDGSSTPIKIPPMLTLDTRGNTDKVDFTTSTLDTLNGLKSLTKSEPAVPPALPTTDFNIIATLSDGTKKTIPVSIGSSNTLAQIFTATNAAIDSVFAPSGAQHGITLGTPATCDGTIQFSIDKAYDAGAGLTIASMEITSAASNFSDATKLSKVSAVDDGAGHLTYTSQILDYEAEMGPADNVLQATKLVSYYISADGSIEASYSNGNKISVEAIPNSKQIQMVCKMANGTTITNNDITVNANVLEPANLQLQLATVVNDKGLIAVGSNNFSPGPNSGEVMYSIASNNGFARIISGAIESSNVDLTKQFAELIVAQRSIEANSRSFDTVSRVLEGLIQMGR